MEYTILQHRTLLVILELTKLQHLLCGTLKEIPLSVLDFIRADTLKHAVSHLCLVTNLSVPGEPGANSVPQLGDEPQHQCHDSENFSPPKPAGIKDIVPMAVPGGHLVNCQQYRVATYVFTPGFSCSYSLLF